MTGTDPKRPTTAEFMAEFARQVNIAFGFIPRPAEPPPPRPLRPRITDMRGVARRRSVAASSGASR